MKEDFIRVVEETPKHRIEVVKINPYWDKPKEMHKLIIKTPVGELFVQRDSIMDYGLKHLRRLGEDFDPDSGFFCNYGVGHPLDEFRKGIYDLAPLPLEHFTWFEDNGEWSYFGGNHKNYSGAFRYYVWDKTLLLAIAGYLAREGVVASSLLVPKGEELK